jgi:Zn-dependent M28 family amino/carboxypeptidase
MVVVVLLCGCAAKQTTMPVDLITQQAIYQDVKYLASDDLQGRYFRSNEARIAAKYIRDAWRNAGLTPLPNKQSMYLPVDDPRAAPNVAAMRKGSGTQYILITAHYDHLQPRTSGKDKIYNGADDNASGTAALLAIAKALCSLPAPLDASIVLIAFTGEEAGLVGSEHFANHGPIQPQSIRGLFNLDMISRGEPNTIFLEGTPDAPRLSLAIHRANKQVGLNIVCDKHPDWMYRSDQAPFLELGVPCVFFSVEDHEDYHRVSDHVEKIDIDLATKTAKLTFLAAVDLASDVP